MHLFVLIVALRIAFTPGYGNPTTAKGLHVIGVGYDILRGNPDGDPSKGGVNIALWKLAFSLSTNRDTANRAPCCRRQHGARISQSTSTKKMPVMQGRRFVKAEGRKVDRSNLIYIPLVKTTNKTSTSKSTGFAVPKCLFTNICGLSKTKSRVRAPVALEADLRRQDIDVCIVSETHLFTNMPNASVIIPDYNVFRRDRGWADLDKRKKGDIAVYVRDILKVLDGYRSNLYEFTALTVLLPSDHIMLICGLCNPPKHSYQDYIISFVDLVLNKHPEAAIVCGGDVNRLNMQELKFCLAGISWLISPRGDNACLDNCMTNRADLIGYRRN
ncbi:hypothetical protein AWC38_SpisGene20887 [Stylophora pistillata]|uniref:Endonuclease/exonuclease/phosphatase domain-containing protein n=1 Tax=Stylophora pistillata TaxID=50429 RepID=A0A2B4RF78_STYPI|nr:hypothetical protein AWC38_SpisGene20887 [Stylophora pistillata]